MTYVGEPIDYPFRLSCTDFNSRTNGERVRMKRVRRGVGNYLCDRDVNKSGFWNLNRN